MKKKKKMIFVLVIIGIILILSAINSIYNTYKRNKNYELKGYQTTVATCTQGKSYIKTSTR